MIFLSKFGHALLCEILVLYRRVNTTDLDEVASAIGPWTKLVWLESPTNPRQQISDIRVSHANQ